MTIPADGQLHGSAIAPSLESLQALMHFSFAGQSAGHLIFFAAGAALEAISVAAAVLVLFDKGERLRLLWAIASLFGFGKALLLWNGEGGDFYPISIQIPAMGVYLPPPGSGWIVDFGIPIVAFVYLGRRATRDARIVTTKEGMP